MSCHNRRHCRPQCGCQKPAREIMHPVKENVVNCCSEETIRHVHPSHTTVVNNHLIRNEHVYPHTTSYEDRVREVDVQGTSTGPGSGGGPGSGSQVGGAMNPGGQQGPHNHHHHNHHHNHKGCGCRSCRRRNRWF